MCPVWLLVAVAMVGVVRGAVSKCLEHRSCQEVKSESSIMDCLQLCHSDLTAETPVIPGEAHLRPPPPSDPQALLPPLASPASPQAKRSYSMEHFRWGKPVGRKRRPIKIYTSNGMDEESAEGFPAEMKRRELAGKMRAEEEEEEKEEDEGEGEGPDEANEKKEEYKIKHFRWGSPPASKRYGGFMRSWDERSQRPLLTLFKNVISKDIQQPEE